MAFIIDIDTGGTFTDGFIANGRDVRTVKVPTTPHDLTVCFLDCIKAAAKAFDTPVEDLLYDTDIIRFSNTIGTNAIIQRDGAKIGLLVSEGMASLAPIDEAEGKASLVQPDMVLEIGEQVDGSGELVTEPQPQQVLGAAQTLIDRGARVLVVALANSEQNPANEHRVREIIKREYPREYLGSVSVFLASDISTRAGQQERINTAVLNAYIHPKLARLLYKAGEELRQLQYNNTLFIGHNNGAVARVAKTRAINTYNSGPAAGLLGAREIGRLYGIENLISTDMGGTSYDIGYVRNGDAGYALSPDVEGFACNLPMMSILALGTGGGSIAHLDDGELKVGPQSAGALPGPACFNLGGNQPTLTDANLVLGVLDPDYFLGGSMALDMARAREAIERVVAEPLGISVEEAALRIKQIVDRNMGSAVAGVAKKLPEGETPVIVAYGGAGGLHACDIAAAAGIDKVIMTPFSAVSSAYSSSLLDPGHLYYRRVDSPFATLSIGAKALQVLEDAITDMRREAERDMRGEGFASEQLRDQLQLFVSSGGHEVMVQVPSDFYRDSGAVERALEQIQQALALEKGEGKGADAGGDLHISTIALMVNASAPHYLLQEQAEQSVEINDAVKRNARLYSAAMGDFVETPVYDREKLLPGAVINGPALVESATTTLLVAERWKMTIDRFNNAVFEQDHS